MPEQVLITYENESQLHDRKLSLMSPELAYPNTFTDGFDWRYQIKTDDLIDSIDSEAIWYKSTILNEKVEHFASSDKESK